MLRVKTDVLKREISRRGTQEEFAREVLGTTPSYLSLILNGHRVPGPKMRERMMKRLGLEFDDLFEEARDKELARR
jgi:transcriptional regulator with XRE-family HTH domain